MLKKILNRKMLAILFLGIASGVPLGVVISIFQTWATEAGISLKTISLAGLVQLPYTWKFIWSPLMDRYRLPFLGRRRGWMLVCQILMFISIALLGQTDPKEGITIAIILATIVSFAGASHDIVIDAYRRDILTDEELGFGSAMATNSYLIGFRYVAVVCGLLICQWLQSPVDAAVPGLGLPSLTAWSITYMVLAGFIGIGIIGTFIAPAESDKIPEPKSLRDAVILPFKEYLMRPGAWEIIIFILIYKVGDNLAQHMLMPFYLKMGYEKAQIAIMGKLVGFWAMFGGGFLGGFFLLRYSMRNCLLWFGIFQGLANLSFILLDGVPPNNSLLAFAVGIENLTAGMGTAAFAAFMLKLSNRQFSATQFALFSSLMGVPRVILPSIVGTTVEYIPWTIYFTLCTLAAAPGVILIYFRAHKWLEKT
jgi:MFS transporter, PAT family, beta-lactamase induction signal transducer AmpG